MIGFRARLGFLLPPGNPTVEPEMMALAPPGVSLHFHRLHAEGVTGSLDGQEERNRQMVASLDGSAQVLAMVKPDVMVLAHTSTSYTLGQAAEAALVARIEAASGRRMITAFGAVLAALAALGLRRIALATPYSPATTAMGRAHLEAHGIRVVRAINLPGVTNIYDETPERAYRLARMADTPEAEAIFLSGVGMPTIAILQAAEEDLGKPVISAAGAMFWHALRCAGVAAPIAGHGRLLRL
ncbi:MAG: hypothetical protein KGL12_15370 [Rhodospirillales bacterium]|nr:hypothetical protein [Rhodospirillales bacterium]